MYISYMLIIPHTQRFEVSDVSYLLRNQCILRNSKLVFLYPLKTSEKLKTSGFLMFLGGAISLQGRAVTRNGLTSNKVVHLQVCQFSANLRRAYLILGQDKVFRKRCDSLV